jgi:Histidine kinase-, DNA gyrase B-, and HSP90-like ATPase
MNTALGATDTFAAQKELVERLNESGWDLIVGDAFVRGMRDIGYKSTSFAMAEIIDNSIQAGATWIDVVFGFNSGSLKPTRIAIIDNGWGMVAPMVRASLVWGAGTRYTDRQGFGKYGYGLPSASVSQCLRVEVYSKVHNESWAKSYLDVQEISEGKWTDMHRINTPKEVLEEPPAFVIEHLKERGRWPLDSGTVVVWDKLDPTRIDRQRREELRNRLVSDLGVIYRNYLVGVPMMVDGVKVEPCDPLFLTPGFRYYDLDGDRAEELPSAVVDVADKATKEALGKLRVRFSRMPASFFRKPEAKHTNKPSRHDMNERLPVADAHNGIIFLRHGREIDVVKPPKRFYSVNATTDRFWAIEVDFDATLDDEFSMTTAKQQVVPSDRIWDILSDKAKIFDAVAAMKSTYHKEASKIRDEAEARKKASIEALEDSAKFRTTKQPQDTPARRKEAEENLKSEARRRARESGVSEETVERELVAQQEGVTRAVETEDLPGAPFFRCIQRGGQRVLLLNVAHPFYTDLYAGPGSSTRLRAGLELLLWTLGEAEVDADPESDRRRFYEAERPQVWSPNLKDALTSLRKIEVVDDRDEDPTAA